MPYDHYYMLLVVTAVAAPAVGITVAPTVGVVLTAYVIAVMIEQFVAAVVIVVVVTEGASLGNMGAHNIDRFHNHVIVGGVVVVVVGNIVAGVAMGAIWAHN
jgi:hypothetical protein